MSSVKVNGKVITGRFSKESRAVRDMYNEDGDFLGIVAKLEEGGYRVVRVDGKQRTKETLEQAYRAVARAN